MAKTRKKTKVTKAKNRAGNEGVRTRAMATANVKTAPANAKTSSTTSSAKQTKGSSGKPKTTPASTTSKKRTRSTSAGNDAAADESTAGPSAPTKRVTRSALAKANLIPDGGDSEGFDEINEPQVPQYKEYIDAFTDPPGDDEDHISKLPSETLDNILSYCVLDHEPERAIRMKNEGSAFKERSHVLLSLAAMSKHFRDHVESFCRREIIRNKPDYFFLGTVQYKLDQKPPQQPVRHSPRFNDLPIVDRRCYRMELVYGVQTMCIRCGCWGYRWAVMANAVKCHVECESKALPQTIVSIQVSSEMICDLTFVQTMTAALRKYDLKDWMLVKTRKPGPRAKKIDLPQISYGTVRTGTPLWLGMVIAHRFFEKDVQMIAKLVHGDVEKHITDKRQQRINRRAKKRRTVHRELKVRYHADSLEKHRGDGCEDEEHHEERTLPATCVNGIASLTTW